MHTIITIHTHRNLWVDVGDIDIYSARRRPSYTVVYFHDCIFSRSNFKLDLKMWCLTSKENHKVIYIGGKNKETLICRTLDAQSNCFVIPDDPSISRKHALLSNVINELFIQDMGSRYGTFLNDNKIDVSPTKTKLKDGDIVKFGKMGSVWSVHFKSFVTCTSTLKGENLQNLIQCLSNLSGSLKTEWDDTCMYLTMPAITITMKVALALVQGAHIVTVDFWYKCLEAVNNQTSLPDPTQFTPQVIESTLNKEIVSFVPDERRKKLFSGMKVIFFSKHKYELYKVVLSKASATPLLLSESKMTKSMLCQKDVIVIQCSIPAPSQETQDQRDSILEIVNYMKAKGKRLIADVEIGLAVLYCSTQKYCNPSFNFPSEVMKKIGPTTQSGTVLAQESQEPTQRIALGRENVIIDESLSTSNVSSKRKLSEDNDFQENLHKKVAVSGADKNGTSGGIKRKNNEVESNPTKKHAAGEFEDDDDFNFVNRDSTNKEDGSSTKRLNLIKPQKRKLGGEDEDDLFQFIQDQKKDSENTSKHSMFGVKNIKTELNMDSNYTENNVDISTLRGAKLGELMKNNERLINDDSMDIKKVIKEELDEKMHNLSLGTTIVKVRTDLVVKKEPLQIEEKSGNMKNFKKFKKVWPIKMQVTIIPRSSNVHKLETSNTNKNASAHINSEEKIQDSEVF